MQVIRPRTGNSSSRTSWWVPARVDEPEWLDNHLGSLEDVRENFADMWRINRYLGGLRALTVHLFPRLRTHKGVITIADLGTGSAEIPVTIARWARGEGLNVQILALDLSARNLAIAQSQTTSTSPIKLVQANAHCLPFASVDYLMSSLFLHHFTPEQVIELLRQAFAGARKGLVMTDVVRGRLPLIAFKLSQPIFAQNYLTRHDGAISIRRAYTPSEWHEFALAAGLTHFRVYQHPLWRMTLVADK